MRVGQKGRLCHRWWARGKRPPGVQDQRHEWASLLGAARPGGEAAFALVLPAVNTDTMQIFLDRFAATLAEGEHAVMVLPLRPFHVPQGERGQPTSAPPLTPSPRWLCAPQTQRGDGG